MNYDKLRDKYLKEIKHEDINHFAESAIDMFEENGKDIDELIEKLETLNSFDKKITKYYTNQDYKQVTDYEINLNQYGFYCNYCIENYDVLEHNIDYLKQKNIQYLIGEAYDKLGNKIELAKSLYIKDWNKPYHEIEELRSIIHNMPKIEFTLEEMHERVKKQIKILEESL